ncbi:alanine racemase [Treponema parvum]|uniref:Alanine racemase n=1 Tax=Treponema parvum TaxID=138851 RepID=A0A975IF37_9SPIR|nr:alanine racemase [Treponema parvum]QTQ13919.1 alanine racemase [Treponema parvum]
MRSTKLIVDLKNLSHNFRTVRSLVKRNVKICAAVKADAYGHGAVRVAQKLLEEGVDFLAVAAADEGLELRSEGINTPILVLSLCAPGEIELLVKNNLTPLVFDCEYVNLFERAAGKLKKHGFPVHLAVDTGMGRIGCAPEEAAFVAGFIKNKCLNLKLEGMCTHFASSDGIGKDDVIYTENQIKAFTKAWKAVADSGTDPGIRHCANSAAIFSLPETHLDMVRPGIVLYGYYPGQITKEYLDKKEIHTDLRPVMTFETQIAALRHFKSGSSVSYGYTWTASSETRIAILPVGYADGLLRCFSPGLEVAVGGKLYPVRGRICMDQCMIEIGMNNGGVKRWDRAVIFGSREEGAILSAEDVAKISGTISYEVMTGISKRVPRVYR